MSPLAVYIFSEHKEKTLQVDQFDKFPFEENPIAYAYVDKPSVLCYNEIKKSKGVIKCYTKSLAQT